MELRKQPRVQLGRLQSGLRESYMSFTSVANGGLTDAERIASALVDPCLRMYVESLEITVEDTALLVSYWISITLEC